MLQCIPFGLGGNALHVALGSMRLTQPMARRHAIRRDPANTRVQALRYAFDGASFAGGIPTFEDHHQLELLVWSTTQS